MSVKKACERYPQIFYPAKIKIGEFVNQTSEASKGQVKSMQKKT